MRKLDPWCRPSRNVDALVGVIAYARLRWGAAKAKRFRRTLKPLMIARFALEMVLRAIMIWKRAEDDDERTLRSAGALWRFLCRDAGRFLRAR